VKAYAHNGCFKSLEELAIVAFLKTLSDGPGSLEDLLRGPAARFVGKPLASPGERRILRETQPARSPLSKRRVRFLFVGPDPVGGRAPPGGNLA